MTCTEEYKEHYRNFVCSKFYALVLSCTAHAVPQPHKRAKRRFCESPRGLCPMCAISPTRGRVWAGLGSESDLIHFFGFTTPE